MKRQGMAVRCQRHPEAAIRMLANCGVEDGAESLRGVTETGLIQCVKHRHGRSRAYCGSLDGVARKGGDRRGLSPLAADVTDYYGPPAARGLEDIVEVAPHFLPAPGRSIDRAYAQAGNRRRSWGDEGGLQGLREHSGARLRFFGPLSCGQQLAFVFSTVGGMEHRGTDQNDVPIPVPFDGGVDERRHQAITRACEVDGYLANLSLHPQKRRMVRLVEDAPSRRQQILKSLATNDVFGTQPCPCEKSLVHPDDGPVHER